jgi:hypothetical protein
MTKPSLFADRDPNPSSTCSWCHHAEFLDVYAGYACSTIASVHSSAAPKYGLLTCSSAPGTTRTCDPLLRSYLDALEPALASSFSTSSCCPSLSRADRIGEFWS